MNRRTFLETAALAIAAISEVSTIAPPPASPPVVEGPDIPEAPASECLQMELLPSDCGPASLLVKKGDRKATIDNFNREYGHGPISVEDVCRSLTEITVDQLEYGDRAVILGSGCSCCDERMRGPRLAGVTTSERRNLFAVIYVGSLGKVTDKVVATANCIIRREAVGALPVATGLLTRYGRKGNVK